MPRRGHGGCKKVIPNNTISEQYLTKDNCYLFSTKRFDEAFADGRITLIEVQETLTKIHQSVNQFQNQKRMTFFIYGFVLLWILVHLINMTVNDLGSLSFNILLFLFVVSMVLVLIFSPYCLKKQMQKDVASIRRVMGIQNLQKWHPRKIHWWIHDELLYIQIQFKLNKPTTLMPVVQVPDQIVQQKNDQLSYLFKHCKKNQI